jgi:nitroimidazol reductase NimA-like FMN-containing flavoprotein (pyridoxamine 5'-phosphate oxidase superfamily)
MSKSKNNMSSDEIEQFLTCARVGRLGLCLDDGPYIVPVGYVYDKGKIAIHSCVAGTKMKALKSKPTICFEVDETFSDTSMYKSVIIKGTAEILDKPNDMIPYLQLHIDKYRVPEEFETYIQKPDRKRDEELAAVRIILITPTEISGIKFGRVI